MQYKEFDLVKNRYAQFGIEIADTVNDHALLLLLADT